MGGAQRKDRNALVPRHQVSDIAPTVKYFTDTLRSNGKNFQGGSVDKIENEANGSVAAKPAVELCK